MEKKKKKGYFFLIFFIVILFVVFGNQRNQRKILILPESIPEKFLENEPDYQKYPVYEIERMKKMEEWEWEGEASFKIKKKKEQKGSWIAYYPVFSSSSYPKEAKKINENIEAYLKSWQEAYFKDEDYTPGSALLYTLTFDVLYHSEDEISIVFDFLVWWKEETRWERKEEIWEENGKSYIFKHIGTKIFYFAVPTGNFFLYQDSMDPTIQDLNYEKEVSSYEIEHFKEDLQNEDGDEVKWMYPQLKGKGEQIEKINADIRTDIGVLLEYSKGNHENKYEIARKTEVDYAITYNNERVICILYKYIYYTKDGRPCMDAYDKYKISRFRFYNAVYDLNTGDRIRYEDLLDSSQMEAFINLLHTIYSRKDEKIDHIFYVDNPVYYLRENEIVFLGSGESEEYPMPAITIPYRIAQQAKTDHPIWDWLLRTEKETE